MMYEKKQSEIDWFDLHRTIVSYKDDNKLFPDFWFRIRESVVNHNVQTIKHGSAQADQANQYQTDPPFLH